MHWLRVWVGRNAVRHAVRHPRVADGFLAVVVAVLGVPSAVADGVDSVPGWLWVGFAHTPLVWRRRAPVAVFWVSVVMIGISDMLAIHGGYQFFVPLFALYAVARYRPRLFLWPALAAFELSIGLAWLSHSLPWPSLVAGTALSAATALLGVTLQTRRAYLTALEERARRLERERDQQARLAATAERTRIAREMHDLVAHHLAVMVALADGAALTATAAPDRAAATMAKVSQTGREALTEMRRLVGLLREGGPAGGGKPGPDEAVGLGLVGPGLVGSRAPQPGLADLDRLLEQVRAAGLRVTLTQDGLPGDWGPGAGLAVYRIVQEALTNTLKHAGPEARADVRLRFTQAGAELEVTDDGAGRFPASPVPAVGSRPAAGHGLTGMIERATSYGGRVEAGPLSGRGWQVRATLRFEDQLRFEDRLRFEDTLRFQDGGPE